MGSLAMGTQAQKPAPDYLSDPNLSVGTKEFLKVLNAGDTPVESLSPKDARQVLTDVQNSVKVDLSGIEELEKNITADGHNIKLTVVRPKGEHGRIPAFIFIHGGGWVLGDYPTHKRLVRDLVVESGYVGIFVNYTPAPEAKYPTQPNEIYAAVKWVAQHGGHELNIDPDRLAITGNSVGGNMTLATALNIKNNGGPVIKCLNVMWPVTDASTEFPSWKMFGQQRFLTSSLMKWMFDNYTAKASDKDQIYYSPLRATHQQLQGLPPTLIHVAENDILRDEGEAMGRKLDEAGVNCATLRYNGVTHDWGLLNGFAELPQTRALIFNSAAFLKKYLE